MPTHADVDYTAVAAAVATTHALHAREPDDHDSVEELRTCKEHASVPDTASPGDEAGVPRDDLFRNDVQLAFAALPEVKPSWTHKYVQHDISCDWASCAHV